MENPRVSIAIDGPSSAGKSTIAKAVARHLDILYLDTGAMYRAIGLYMLRNGIDMRDAGAVAEAVGAVELDVKYHQGAQRVYLSGEDVSDLIRTPEASLAASAVSSVPRVREILVGQQRQIAKGIDVVMDGRDIGTHVLKDATLKIYLEAPLQIRARRRYEELIEKGASVPYDQVLSDMARRDHDDSTRAASPLKRAQDAIVINTEDMGIDQIVQTVLRLLREKESQ